MRRMCCLALLLAVFFMASRGSAQTYASEMRNLLSQGHKIDFHKYQILLVPTTNFAIGTMYPLDITQKGFDLVKLGILGDSSNWWTTISENDKRAAVRAIVRPTQPGTIELRGLQTRPLDLGKVFPQITAALAAEGQKNDSEVQVVISASSLQSRTLDWLELDDAVYMEHLVRPSIIEHADKGDFVMTTGDLVLNDFEAHVISKGSPELKKQVEAALNAFVHHSPSSFDLRTNSDGSYTLAGKLPVVVAVYISRPPTMKWAELGDRQLKPLITPYLLSEIAKMERLGTAVSSK